MVHNRHGKALDLLERALHLMDEEKRPLVAARIAAAIDDLLRDHASRQSRAN